MTAEEYYQSRNGGKDSQTSEKHDENLTPAAWVQMMQDYGNIAAKGWKEAHEVLAEHYRHSAEMRVKEQNENFRLRKLLRQVEIKMEQDNMNDDFDGVWRDNDEEILEAVKREAIDEYPSATCR